MNNIPNTSSMRIAIFTDAFLPYVSGVVTVTAELAKGMAAKGHEVHLVIPKYKKKTTFTHKNICVHKLKSIPAMFYKEFRVCSPVDFNVLSKLKKAKVELIHFQTQASLGLQAILTAKMLSLPLAGTFHTFTYDVEWLKHLNLKAPIFQKMSLSYSKMFYDACDLITCPAKSTKEELKKNNIGSRIKVISNGIDTGVFDNSKSKTFKNKYNMDGPILVYIGRIGYEKSIDILLKAFKLIHNQLPKAKLLLVGGGPQLDEYKELAKNLKINKAIFFLGEIKHDKLIKSGIFKAADIFVTASKTENQPVTILESQANGIVCIGVNARGIPDLIKDNVNGFVVRPDDAPALAKACTKLLSDDELKARMQQKTKELIKEHSINTVMDEWEKTYKQEIHRFKENKKGKAVISVGN